MATMTNRQLSDAVWRDPRFFIVFGFGTGLLPKAPGTWGTLAAIPLYLLMVSLPWYLYLIVTGIAFVGGVWLCHQVSHELGEHDYGGIVWDEIVGFLLTMFLAPPHWIWIILGFSLFRVFDILKPQPIRWIDRRVHGGLGIMLDDILAAIPAWIIMQLLMRGYQ